MKFRPSLTHLLTFPGITSALYIFIPEYTAPVLFCSTIALATLLSFKMVPTEYGRWEILLINLLLGVMAADVFSFLVTKAQIPFVPMLVAYLTLISTVIAWAWKILTEVFLKLPRTP